MTAPWRVLVTGSRTIDDVDAVRDPLLTLLHALHPDGRPTDRALLPVLVHGDCPPRKGGRPRGLDRIARDLWRSWRLPEEGHPAEWKRFGSWAGPKRNREMCELGADVCLAWFDDGLCKGTMDCVECAEAYGIPVRRIEVSS